MINVCKCECECVCSPLSVSDSLTVDCSCQALLSMGFFRQEYCSGLLSRLRGPLSTNFALQRGEWLQYHGIPAPEMLPSHQWLALSLATNPEG